MSTARSAIVTVAFGHSTEHLDYTFTSFATQNPGVPLHAFIVGKELPRRRLDGITYHLVESVPDFSHPLREIYFRRLELIDRLDVDFALVVDSYDVLCLQPLPPFEKILGGCDVAACVEHMGARYVMGDPDFSRAVYNPREVTQFTPEGEPIRNVENPTVKAPQGRIQQATAEPTPREVINAHTGEVTNPYAPNVERRSPGGSFAGPERRTLERGVTTSYDLPTEGEVLAEDVRQRSFLNRPKMSEGEALQQIMRDPDAYAKYRAADRKTQEAMLVNVARGSR